MEKLTRQIVFDKVLAHSRQMTEKSTNDRHFNGEDRCLYRNDKGNKCFVGALIPDDVYDKGMEGDSASSVIEKLIINGDEFNCDLDIYQSDKPYPIISFIDELQRIHDEHFDTREHRLKLFAQEYNLKYEEVN